MSVKESSAGGRFKQSEGDWTCADTSCGNVNFARRSECNKCGASKTTTPSIIKKDGTLVKKGGYEIGKQMAEKSKGLFSADDWQCKSCGNVNWARRTTCNVCNAPKYGKVEQRTGYGGGFMERDEVVEYKEKENDDDGDYDEFGRLRKDKRGKLPIVKSLIEISPAPVDDDDEEEDDEDADVSKYQLESDDDDEDVDLSKYALSDDSDIDSKSKTEPKSSNHTKKSSRSKSRSRSRSYSSSSSSSRSRSSSSRRRRRRRRSYSRSSSRSRSRDRHHKRRRSSSNSRSRSRSPKRRLSDSNRSRFDIG